MKSTAKVLVLDPVIPDPVLREALDLSVFLRECREKVAKATNVTGTNGGDPTDGERPARP